MAVGMVDINDYELNKENASEHFKCPLCNKSFTNPVSTKCEPTPHTFCHDCIKNYIANKASCPICEQPVHEQDLKFIDKINNADRLTKIENKNSFWKILSNSPTNRDALLREECSGFVKCQAADIMCPWEGTPSGLVAHRQTCVHEKLRPVITELIKNAKQDTIEKQRLRVMNGKLSEEIKRIKNEIKRSSRASIVGSLRSENLNDNAATYYAEDMEVQSKDDDKQFSADLFRDFFRQLFNYINEHCIQPYNAAVAAAIIAKQNDAQNQFAAELEALRRENTERGAKIDELENNNRSQNETLQAIQDTVRNNASLSSQIMDRLTATAGFTTTTDASARQAYRNENENPADGPAQNQDANASELGRNVARPSPAPSTSMRSNNNRSRGRNNGRHVNRISHCVISTGGVNFNMMGGRNTNVGCGFINQRRNEQNANNNGTGTNNTSNVSASGNVFNGVNTGNSNSPRNSSNVTGSGHIFNTDSVGYSSMDASNGASNLGSNDNTELDSGNIIGIVTTAGGINYNMMGGHNNNVGSNYCHCNNGQNTANENSTENDGNNSVTSPSDEHAAGDNGLIDEHVRNYPEIVHPPNPQN